MMTPRDCGCATAQSQSRLTRRVGTPRRFYMSLNAIARNLAAAFQSGPWNLAGLIRYGTQACGSRPRWLRPLARRVLERFPSPPAEPEELASFVAADRGFLVAWERGQVALQPAHYFWASSAFQPAAWPVPALATPAALSEWLG